MDELSILRNKIDEIDQKMQELFIHRMEVVSAISEYKMANDLSVYDHQRETEIIQKNIDRIKGSPYAPFYQQVLESILKESKMYQKAIIIGRTTL
ncbi:MAG: chorismate mutase [Candidatus Izemoplasmatales bacterium]|jgi:monofunctional chorismate mutase|nr:chorismate mutase [Candidatus Izemoplasmatales bacterium]MDD4595602.1 chorismate mutase [Candidatus Izemoplasmatales bacterium]